MKIRNFLILVFFILSSFSLAYGQPVILSGQVTDISSTGIANVDLDFFDTDGNKLIYDANTDGSGNYFVIVDPSVYHVAFNPPPNFVPKKIDNVSIFTNTVLNVTLLAGHVLSGKVTDPLSNPVLDVDLNVNNALSGELLYTPNDNTDSSGNYSIVIPGGVFNISYRPPKATKLASLELKNVNITKDTVINVTVPNGVNLSGQVIDPLNSPVELVDLDLVKVSTGEKVLTPQDNTDNNGNYLVVIPPGNYDVIYSPPPATHLATLKLANVAINNDTVINVALDSGLLVSGKVSNSMAVGILNVDLDAFDTLTGAKLVLANDKTDANGNYTTVIPPGIYHIGFNSPAGTRYVSLLKKNLKIAKDTTINATLTNGFIINGKVTDPSATGVFKVDLDAEKSVTKEEVFIANDNTNPNGDYAIILPGGTYNLNFDPPLSTKLAGLGIGPLTISKDTTINVSLANGFFISGTVKNSFNAGILYVDLDAISKSTGKKIFLSNDNSDSSGNYQIIVPAGLFDLVYNAPLGTTYASGILRNVNISKDTLINMVLQQGLSLSGTVKDSSNNFILGAQIKLYQTGTSNFIPTPGNHTDSNGFYQVYILSGIYDITYEPPATGLYDSLKLVNENVSSNRVINVILPKKPFIRGDANTDAKVNLSDIIFLVNFIFRGGPAPNPILAGDVTCDSLVNLGDIIRLVNFIFKGAPSPNCP